MQPKDIRCKIASMGAWGSYFESWDALQALFNGADLPETSLKGPKPEVIPANERRRAPLPVRLAVESSWQATQACGLATNELTCVFVSGLGDTDLTDYMCKTLASEHKELSPTKFHNSVHNAPAGYWTISTETMSAANSVAGYEQSVSLTLLEAMIQCEAENVPLLITFYDAPVSEMLMPMLKNQESFAFSIVIVPQSSEIDGTSISAKVESQTQSQWPELDTDNQYLSTLYADNPSARILCLAEQFSKQTDTKTTFSMPLSKGSTLSFSLG